MRIYDENPYDRHNNTVKITVREIPLEFSNTDLLSYFKYFTNLHLKSDIMYSRERQANGQFSNCYNGLFYVEGPVNTPLPKKYYINAITFYAFYNGQSTICEKCKHMGHKANNTNCPLHDNPTEQIIVQEPESKDETSEDNLVLHYDSSPEKIKEKMPYYAKKIKIRREKLGLNPSEIIVEHKPDSLNNGVNSTGIATS